MRGIKNIILLVWLLSPLCASAIEPVHLTIHGENHNDSQCAVERKEIEAKARRGEIYLGNEGIDYNPQEKSKIVGLDYEQISSWARYIQMGMYWDHLLPYYDQSIKEHNPALQESVNNEFVEFVGNSFRYLWHIDSNFRDLIAKYIPEVTFIKTPDQDSNALQSVFYKLNFRQFFQRMYPDYDNARIKTQNPDKKNRNFFFDYKDSKFSQLPKPAQDVATAFLKNNDKWIERALQITSTNAFDPLDPTKKCSENEYYVVLLRNKLWMIAIADLFARASNDRKEIVLLVGDDHADELKKLIEKTYLKKVTVSIERCEKN